MSTFWWIVLSGFAMSAIALSGSLTLVLRPTVLRKILLPLVAFAAGALLGGALFHMLPTAAGSLRSQLAVYLWFIAGFVTFYMLEQYLHWHHCHRGAECERQPMGTLILVADGLHNLIGGLAVGASFVLATPVGVSAWVAAAAHEVPQELGDFGVLVHRGWGPRRALVFNVLSGLTFPVGALLAYWAGRRPRDHVPGPLRRRELRLHRGYRPHPPADGDGGLAAEGGPHRSPPARSGAAAGDRPRGLSR